MRRNDAPATGSHTGTCMSVYSHACVLVSLCYRPRPTSTYGVDPNNSEPYSSLWQYIDTLRTRSTMFHNFLYSEADSSVSVYFTYMYIAC